MGITPTLEIVFKCDVCGANVVTITSDTHMKIVENIRMENKGNEVFYNIYHKDCEKK